MSRRSSFGLIHDATASQKKIKSYKIKQSYRLETSIYTSENNAWCSFLEPWMVFDPNSQLLLLLCIYFPLNSDNGKLLFCLNVQQQKLLSVLNHSETNPNSPNWYNFNSFSTHTNARSTHFSHKQQMHLSHTSH